MKRQLIVLFLAFSLIALFPLQYGQAQTSRPIVSVVPKTNSVLVGDTLTVNITISNVQNLYGLDLTLNWNSSAVRTVTRETFLGIESYPNGILYSPLVVVEDSVNQESGVFHLVAFSEGAAPSFNGSGTIAILTFNITGAGHSTLTLQSELSDHPLPEEDAEFIEHDDVSGSVNAAIIPEFPEMTMVALLLIAATIGLLFTRKRLKKSQN